MQNSKFFGTCATCSHHTALTKHYLIPKKRHQKMKNSSLNVLLDSVILYDERTLAKVFNTLEKLCDNERLSKHFIWVSKCKKGVQ
jgi:hypothetical protein